MRACRVNEENDDWLRQGEKMTKRIKVDYSSL